MKIIKEKDKTQFVLENKDVVEITSLYKKHIKLTIKCLGNTLHIEENLMNLENLGEEEKAIQVMKNYLEKEKRNVKK